MKKIILPLAVMAITFSMESHTGPISSGDTIATDIRLKSLRNKKESLKKEIKIQDSRRNRQIPGVTAETLEEMNDKQDSICLELRSELMDVTLGIKEIAPEVGASQLVERYNQMVNRRDSVITDSVAPIHPSKKGSATLKR